MHCYSSGRRFNLGLRWLDASDDDAPRLGGRDWDAFLAAATALPEPHRLWLARLWPLLALVSGPLALSGLMVWPERSGVHLLLFLMVFVLVPLALLLWTALNGLLLGRAPWWRHLITRHSDPVVARWFARQSLLSHGLFCIAGLAWLWLALLTRQVIFYWSTSIAPVAERVVDLFQTLSLGVLPAPEPAAVRAAEAGAITGWEGALLVDSLAWAGWLTQLVALWVLVPWALLLGLCQWRLRRGVTHWPRFNHRLRRRFDRACEPALGYRAEQPEQPLVEPAGHLFPVVAACPVEPGFGWRVNRSLPAGSVYLGDSDHAADETAVRAQGKRLSRWYIAGHTVPTGDLADLIHLHRDSEGAPELTILLDSSHLDEARLDALRHSWGVFLERNDLHVPLQLLSEREGSRGASA